MKRAGVANVRHYVIYDFRGKAPRGLYRLLERLKSQGLVELIQYSVVRAERLDIALQIATSVGSEGPEWSSSGASGPTLNDGEHSKSPLLGKRFEISTLINLWIGFPGATSTPA